MSDILSDLISGLIEKRAWGCLLSLIGLVLIAVFVLVALGSAS